MQGKSQENGGVGVCPVQILDLMLGTLSLPVCQATQAEETKRESE
jgi:hypothetical protein